MKIAFICSDRGPCPPVRGGAIQLLISKVAPILAKKHEVTVFSITDPMLSNQETVHSVKYERFDQSQYFQQVLKRIQEKPYDIIQVYNRPGWISFLRDAAPNAKLLLSLHNLVYETIKVEKELAEKGIKEADRILTVSQFVANDTARKIPEAAEKIQVLYTGVDVKEYAPIWTAKGKQWRKQIRSRYHIGDQDTVLLFVGRLVSVKGCHVLLQAMKEILVLNKNMKLLIVGSKWYADESTSAYIEELQKLANQIPNNVIFTSYVPVHEIPKYFSSADFFICPSQWKEPLARVHYEAMAAGLPIITTKRGGNAEVLRNKEVGIMITEYKEPIEFVKAIVKLLENPDLAEKMGTNGRRNVEETYNFDRVALDLDSIYKELYFSKED